MVVLQSPSRCAAPAIVIRERASAAVAGVHLALDLGGDVPGFARTASAARVRGLRELRVLELLDQFDERALEQRVHLGRHGHAVARGQRAHMHPVAQREVVVVARQLAVHAVAQQVGPQVHQRFAQRELAPVCGTRHLGQRHAGEEDRVQLERAVVALGREVGAQELDLLVQRLQHAAQERRRHRRLVGGAVVDERGEAVDPVLHAPPGHVGGDETRRRDAHPAVDQRGPALGVAHVAAGQEGLAEAGCVVELVQQDVPLDVGARVGEPVNRRGQHVGLAVELEAAVEQRVDLVRSALVGVDHQVDVHVTRAAKVREQRRVVERVVRRGEDRRRRGQRDGCGVVQVHARASCSAPCGRAAGKGRGVMFMLDLMLMVGCDCDPANQSCGAAAPARRLNMPQPCMLSTTSACWLHTSHCERISPTPARLAMARDSTSISRESSPMSLPPCQSGYRGSRREAQKRFYWWKMKRVCGRLCGTNCGSWAIES